MNRTMYIIYYEWCKPKAIDREQIRCCCFTTSTIIMGTIYRVVVSLDVRFVYVRVMLNTVVYGTVVGCHQHPSSSHSGLKRLN